MILHEQQRVLTPRQEIQIFPTFLGKLPSTIGTLDYRHSPAPIKTARFQQETGRFLVSDSSESQLIPITWLTFYRPASRDLAAERVNSPL
jgi:hypothetical protein